MHNSVFHKANHPFIVLALARLMRWLAVAAVALMMSGCGTVGYYSQAIGGHLSLMWAREPIADVIASEDTSEELRELLTTIVEARKFAAANLGLPNNDSYSTYVATGKRAVTWNVVASEEFSLTPKTWCFPVAGCVSYRGYFDKADADKFAANLADEGWDVQVGGASAYSTLGWFDDPILDTMLRGSEANTISTLFHELAHQVVYVKNDSSFNEAFASFVERHGLEVWLQENGQAEQMEKYDASSRRAEDFIALLKNTREALVELYEQSLEPADMRMAKAAMFDQMRTDYEAMKETKWAGYKGYDGWFKRDLNNARLISVSTYRRYIPAFERVFEESGRDLDAFYEAVAALGALPADERTARLENYIDSAEQSAGN